MPVYIEKPTTEQPTGQIYGNLPFRKLENRKKAEISKLASGLSALKNLIGQYLLLETVFFEMIWEGPS